MYYNIIYFNIIIVFYLPDTSYYLRSYVYGNLKDYINIYNYIYILTIKYFIQKIDNNKINFFYNITI